VHHSHCVPIAPSTSYATVIIVVVFIIVVYFIVVVIIVVFIKTIVSPRGGSV
jgi:hypothetical protein